MGRQAQAISKHVASRTLEAVDRLNLWVFPVLLGTGKRLFGEGTRPAGLELVESTTSSTGVAIHTYRRSGAPRYGSFALED